MINNIKNRIVSFVGAFVCASCFIPGEVFARRVEIQPTNVQVSQHDENLIMMYFPDQVNQVILAHMSQIRMRQTTIWDAGFGGGNMWQNVQRQTQIAGIIYTNIGIDQGSFRVETPQGASLTISSPRWFRIRIVQTQVIGQNHTFPMPVIECRVEDVEELPKVVLEYPEPRDIQPEMRDTHTYPQSGSTEIQPIRTIPSPEFDNLLVRSFPVNVNNKILDFLKRNITDELPRMMSIHQSAVHKVAEVPDSGGEIIIPSPEGNIRISSSKWFRVRIIKTRVEGETGIFYAPIVEYRLEDIENPPRVVSDNV